ncbi:MAG: hypothetical protein V7672_00860 [Brevundimonas sp.]|uniref:carph-isopro domain-containing protein n=1 Tax=Brevundimonas sp. TaxID=1871086 RepID=UPI003002019F
MQSVFQKFDGIRPMAAKIGLPSSTVKSWHRKGSIPSWRHDAILAAAKQHGIRLTADELQKVRPDLPTPANDTASQERAA